MSRGGPNARSARDGTALEYVPVAGVARHVSRPPKLPRIPRYQAHPSIDA
jgi:hypothetical protein